MNCSTPCLPVYHQLKLMPIESVMPYGHLILCRPLLLLPSIHPSIRVFSNESALHIRWTSIGVSASASVFPMNTCQGMFNSKTPVCCFLSLLSLLFLISPCRARGAGKPLPGRRSKSWDACIGLPSLAFPFDERGYLWPSFLMDHLLALWSLLLLASLVTCKVWSLGLYLKKLLVYILLQNSIKHLCSIRAWVPVSVFLSLSLYFWLIPWRARPPP